jgi:hypothetical protein
MLLCHGCNRGYHTKCVGLAAVPAANKGHCSECRAHMSQQGEDSPTARAPHVLHNQTGVGALQALARARKID